MFFVLDAAGNQFGPASVAMLRDWASQDRLGPDSELLEQGSGKKFIAKDIPGIFGPAAPSAAVPPTASGPTYSAAPTAQPGKKGMNAWMIVGICFAVVCCCGGAILSAIIFPVFAQARTAAKQTQGLSNMKSLALGTIMYTADFDDKFPLDMSSAKTVKKAIMPYVKSEASFVSLNAPEGEILGNAALSGKNSVLLEDPATVAMYWDSKPWPGSPKRGILAYADGSARKIPFEELETLVAAPVVFLKE
jgi:hypothetical protein